MIRTTAELHDAHERRARMLIELTPEALRMAGVAVRDSGHRFDVLAACDDHYGTVMKVGGLLERKRPVVALEALVADFKRIGEVEPELVETTDASEAALMRHLRANGSANAEWDVERYRNTNEGLRLIQSIRRCLRANGGELPIL